MIRFRVAKQHHLSQPRLPRERVFLGPFFLKKGTRLYLNRLTHTAWEVIDALYANADTIQ